MNKLEKRTTKNIDGRRELMAGEGKEKEGKEFKLLKTKKLKGKIYKDDSGLVKNFKVA